MKMQISYYLHASGNYHVTLQAVRQTISLCPGYFRKMISIQGNVQVGCCEIDMELACEVGFIASVLDVKVTA